MPDENPLLEARDPDLPVGLRVRFTWLIMTSSIDYLSYRTLALPAMLMLSFKSLLSFTLSLCVC
jgi:hypothetical protein